MLKYFSEKQTEDVHNNRFEDMVTCSSINYKYQLIHFYRNIKVELLTTAQSDQINQNIFQVQKLVCSAQSCQ